MARHLRAIFKFRTADDPEQVKWALAILRAALRALRVRDRHAELRVLPDDDPPAVHHDADGD